MRDLSSPNSIPLTANSSVSIKSLNWACVFPFCFLKNEILYPIIPVSKWLIPTIILIGLPFYIFSNQYKSLTRYVGAKSFFLLTCRNGILLLLISFFSNLFGLPRPSNSSWILIWFTPVSYTHLTLPTNREV